MAMSGQTIHVDASKIVVDHIPTEGLEVNGKDFAWHLLYHSNQSVGRVYGTVNLVYLGNNHFKILPDDFDFDMHPWTTPVKGIRLPNPKEIIRNIETIGGRLINGWEYTKFTVIFDGDLVPQPEAPQDPFLVP